MHNISYYLAYIVLTVGHPLPSTELDKLPATDQKPPLEVDVEPKLHGPQTFLVATVDELLAEAGHQIGIANFFAIFCCHGGFFFVSHLLNGLKVLCNAGPGLINPTPKVNKKCKLFSATFWGYPSLMGPNGFQLVSNTFQHIYSFFQYIYCSI